MVIDGDGMCADANSMAFFDAMMNKQPPPDKLGLTYMLSGDNGASNTDPNGGEENCRQSLGGHRPAHHDRWPGSQDRWD